MILGKMVIQLSKEPSQRLLKHVVSDPGCISVPHPLIMIPRFDVTCASLTTPAPVRLCASVCRTSSRMRHLQSASR